MALPPPFDTDEKPKRCSWHGGSRRAPTWGRNTAGDVDAAGLHELLRRAGLPRAELLHMGATARLLSRYPCWSSAGAATLLLGRVAWDASYGAAGESYDEAIHFAQSYELGRNVLATAFPC